MDNKLLVCLKFCKECFAFPSANIDVIERHNKTGKLKVHVTICTYANAHMQMLSSYTIQMDWR